MQAHLIQTDIVWENPTENIARVREMISAAPVQPGDLIILPEIFATGFSLRLDKTTPAAAMVLNALQEIATTHRVYLQGGRTVATPGQDKAENRAPVHNPQGELIGEYAKVHPFGFGREPEVIQGGTRTLCYDWSYDRSPGTETIRVGVGICYDLRFPELFRTLMLDGATAFALGANWPSARQSHWRTLSIARAIENQAYMFAVNRCGNDPHLQYAGGTIAIDPAGEILGELGDQPGVLTVPVDPQRVRTWRDTFPALRDVKLLNTKG